MTLTQAKSSIEELGRDGLQELIDRLGEDCINAALDLDIRPSNIEEAYSGQFSSDEDFARDIAKELDALDENESWPYTCIDWEQAAKELMYDYSEQDGFYFRNL